MRKRSKPLARDSDLQENVEIIRKVYEQAGNDPDANVDLLAAEAVMDWTASRAPYSGIYRGQDEILAFWRIFAEAWEEWSVELKEVIEIDPETILCVTLVRARGKGSQIPIEARGAGVWSLRDGKVTRATLYQSKAEALNAVGLSEQDAHASSE
jgi:ketosteroid isomerase-like protein